MGVTGRGPGLLARGPWDVDRVIARWTEQPFDAGGHAEAQADAAIAELRERGSPTHDAWAPGWQRSPPRTESSRWS